MRKFYEALWYFLFSEQIQRDCCCLWWSESHRKCNYLIFLGLILHFAETRFWTHSQQVARPGCEPSFIPSSWATFKACNPQAFLVSNCFAFLLRQPSSDCLVSESLSFLILLDSLVVLTPYRYHVCVCVCVCVCVSCFNHVWLFETPWTVARQAPLSMGFSRQEYWSGLPCPPPGIEPQLYVSCIGRWVLYH